MRSKLIAAALTLFGISAQGALLIFTAELSSESVSTPSPGTGFTIVTYDSAAHTLRVQAEFSGLLGNTTASHIHAPTPPPSGAPSVATQTPSFTGFPLGVKAGTFDQTLDLTQASSFRAGYVTANGGVAGAEAALVSSLTDGTAYLNIHTTVVPGGEIRGFLQLDSDVDGVPDADDEFPNSGDVGGTVHIGDCDTGVENQVFEDGSTLSDLIGQAADGATNHGKFVSAVAQLKNGWKKDGTLTAEEAEAIQNCAAEASLP